jgi:ribose transport system ATP-binding protein
LRVDGRPVKFDGSRAAEAEGIVLIHQEFNLADDLTVAQNIFWVTKRSAACSSTTGRCARTRRGVAPGGPGYRPDTRVRHLIVAEKQLVEIAKALARKARLLIMDEPTAYADTRRNPTPLQVMARLKADGVTIIYISHKLDEVERTTDEVIVMRDGRFVARAPTATVSRQQMANLMVGRELSDLFPPKQVYPLKLRRRR